MARRKLTRSTSIVTAISTNMANAVRTYYILEYRRHVETRQGGGPCTYGCRPMPQWDGGVDADGKVYEQARLVRDRPLRAEQPDQSAPPGTGHVPGVEESQAALPQPVRQPTGSAACRGCLPIRPRCSATTSRWRITGSRRRRRFISSTTTWTSKPRHGAPCMIRPPTCPRSIATAWGSWAVPTTWPSGSSGRHSRMYVFDRNAYDAAWGDRIPQELRQAADHFYSEVL